MTEEIKYPMPALTEEECGRLMEVAAKRINQYQKMKRAQECANVKPRGGVEFYYQTSIDLMRIVLASLDKPAIMVPDKIDGSMIARVFLDETTSDKVDAYVQGFNACVDKTKRMNS